MDAFFGWVSHVFSPTNSRRVAVELYRDLTAWSDIRCTTPLAVLAGLNCVAWMIVMKAQSQQAFHLGDARMGAAALAASVLIVLSRWGLINCQRAQPAFWIKVLLALVCIVPFAALFIVATPRNSGLAVSMVCLLGVASANSNLFLKRRPSPKLRTSALRPMAAADVPKFEPYELVSASIAISPTTISAEQPNRQPEPDDEFSEELSEHFERVTDQHGRVVVKGVAVAKFEPGWSLATVHVPFQPPFEQPPEFECTSDENPAVRLRPAAVFRYGARVELKRSEGIDEEWEVPVQFHAKSKDHAASAA